MTQIFIPALKGLFGDWIYYSCLMPAHVIAERIDFAKELHKNKKLSELIQREIREGRGIKIAEYLHNEKERFFNSLVVAVYGGKPTWHEIGVESQNENISIEDIPDYALNSFGFLQLSGDEKLFALDGQHRLAGLKRSIVEGFQPEDEISVIMVAHSNTPTGLQRTRRLFTTLNKTAVPVSKGEKIALDENDVMAIVARRLVDENPKFSGDRIAYKPTNNIGPNESKSLTTIGNLYDILKILYTKIYGQETLSKLQFWRPDDDTLNCYYEEACKFFDKLQKSIPELQDFFKAKHPESIVSQYRGDFGGSLVFRPIGLSILTGIIAQLSVKYELDSCFDRLSALPRDLTSEPFADVLWDTRKHTIIINGRTLTRDLLLYMLDEVEASKIKDLKKRYADTLGIDIKQTQLPSKLYK